MKKFFLISLFVLLSVYSCHEKSKEKSQHDQTDTISTQLTEVEKEKDIPIKSSEAQTEENEVEISSDELSEVFSKAVEAFPSDSASLYQFYYKWFPAKDALQKEKQVKRIEKLLADESKKRYYSVEIHLKPLMNKIVTSNSINNSQLDSIIFLYSDYDYFRGEGLLTQVLNNDDNYNLVWTTFRIIAEESKKDTTHISALIVLDRHIRTNAELAEAMTDFIVKAIQNNPEGYLEMYIARDMDRRDDFANYISVWDEPDKDLINILKDISSNSKNENYRRAAIEILEKYKSE